MLAPQYTHLHYYRCQFCRSTATIAVRGRAPKCHCGCFMTWQFCEPILTDEQRALAEQGLLFAKPAENEATRTTQCDSCRRWAIVSQMIWLDRGRRWLSKYCSAQCADVATEKLRAIEMRVAAHLLEHGREY
jgi:hypothetical protein